jgi:DNA-binding MarR family transcriptional regulator
MSFPTSSTEPLVNALASRLRCVDLASWAEITRPVEELALSFEDLRLLLALSTRTGSSSVSELARIGGLSLDAAYPAVNRLRGRKYLCEEQRRFSLREEGREVLAILDAAHREGIRAYVDGLDPRDREWLDEAIQMTSLSA